MEITQEVVGQIPKSPPRLGSGKTNPPGQLSAHARCKSSKYMLNASPDFRAQFIPLLGLFTQWMIPGSLLVYVALKASQDEQLIEFRSCIPGIRPDKIIAVFGI